MQSISLVVLAQAPRFARRFAYEGFGGGYVTVMAAWSDCGWKCAP